MENYLIKAIYKLKPNAEFSITDNDYSTVKWDVLEGDAPTKSEIDAAIKEVKADELTQVKASALAKSVLLAKLGITEDEAKLLLS